MGGVPWAVGAGAACICRKRWLFRITRGGGGATTDVDACEASLSPFSNPRMSGVQTMLLWLPDLAAGGGGAGFEGCLASVATRFGGGYVVTPLLDIDPADLLTGAGAAAGLAGIVFRFFLGQQFEASSFRRLLNSSSL